MEWHKTEATGLEAAIARFKRDLPGWWYRVCECQVSCDATCGPTRESPHIDLIPLDDRFNGGFDADLPQPSSLAEALDAVREDALAAIPSDYMWGVPYTDGKPITLRKIAGSGNHINAHLPPPPTGDK